MKECLGLGYTKHFLLFTTSLLACSVLEISPSQAATIALSQGNLLFTNFSQSPSSSFTSTDINAVSISQDGSVTSQADAIAYLGATPPVGFNYTSNQALSENQGSSGLGESEATIKGIFDVDKNTHFSFNFVADLDLTTFTDNPRQEKASASGNLGFALIDIANNNVLDYFNVDGSLTTAGNDSLSHKNSKNVGFSTFTRSNLGGQQEFTTATFDGYLNRHFHNKTTVALVAVNATKSNVAAPVPSMLPALVLSWGVISVGLKRKRQKNSGTCLLEKK
ncbi:hypothetical protein IQ259_10110 [Fortiea sp. LEGE XX443]|uniref:hypothetical protein n=1 Tax=Fortiea sp. LEGE XX443 TaxID=1828611 RepID=UPI001880CAA0|nr:hypothetical protein [Fortiea sp. LEGE XX443]MBE9005388.1 hypothetical protein [Fortiea sp. LEGE XX443]